MDLIAQYSDLHRALEVLAAALLSMSLADLDKKTMAGQMLGKVTKMRAALAEAAVMVETLSEDGAEQFVNRLRHLAGSEVLSD